MLRVYMACFLACLFSVPALAQQSDDLNFASGLEQFHNIRRMLPSYLNNIGFRMLGERKRRVEHLATIEDVNKRRSYVREQMLKDLGGFPDRTPLNARVVGVLERPGYRIEKVIFERHWHGTRWGKAKDCRFLTRICESPKSVTQPLSIRSSAHSAC